MEKASQQHKCTKHNTGKCLLKSKENAEKLWFKLVKTTAVKDQNGELLHRASGIALIRNTIGCWMNSYSRNGMTKKISNISRRQRTKNDDIRLELNQMDRPLQSTLIQKIQIRRLQWFGHVKQISNSRLPAKSLETLVSGTRSRVRQSKLGY